MIAWLKLIHVGAIAVWMAGLVSLPGLYVQRAHVADDDQLFRLQRAVRFTYLRLMSPAGFVAVASGIALIFTRGVFEPWLSAKLTLVGILVLMHTMTGAVILRLFGEGKVYPVWRFVGMTTLAGGLILGVLVLVLAKPQLDPGLLIPAALFEPGGLKRLVEDVNPWSRS
ncbi:MAG: CopD family protein [Acetobacteraceae bacterium]